jgi:hypothetical protein
MAISKEQVDAWFAENKDATADDVAKAVQSIGGLEANQGLADILANRYNIGEKDVTDYYNAYTAPPEKSFAQQYLDANADVNAEFELFKTRDPNKWTPESYASYHYGNYGKNENRAGTEGLTGNIDTLANQILGQNLTSKWSGEGFGSAEANAKDMANILTSIGIKDIKDFGKITKKVPVISTDENGNAYETGETQTVTTYGNIKTGQEVPNTYSERQTGNAFGGTFTGEGNTGYRVQFAPDGTPIFYTTAASSNDLVNLFADDPILGAIAQAAAAYFGGPVGTAALNAAMGKSPEDIAKSAALAYFGNQAFQGLTDTGIDTNVFGETGANLATDIKDLFGKTGSELIGKTAGQFVANEGNVDIGSLLVNQGVGAATNAIVGQIPEFKTLDPIVQKLVAKTVSNTLSGNPGLTTAQLVNTALNEGLKASKSKDSLKSSFAGFDANPDDFIEGYFKPGGEGYIDTTNGEMTVREEPENLDAFLRELSPYATDGGKSIFTQSEDLPEFETVSNRPITSIESILGTPDILETVEADVPELVVTDDREKDYVPGIRTKDIVSDIQDEINPDDIPILFPDLNINDILQTVTPDTKTTVTPTKTVTPPKTTPKTTEDLMASLGLGREAPSQDPYANIKLMEELFGGDTAYKLRALGAPKNLASADLDALARLLRG